MPHVSRVLCLTTRWCPMCHVYCVHVTYTCVLCVPHACAVDVMCGLVFGSLLAFQAFVNLFFTLYICFWQLVSFGTYPRAWRQPCSKSWACHGMAWLLLDQHTSVVSCSQKLRCQAEAQLLDHPLAFSSSPPSSCGYGAHPINHHHC